MMKRFCLLLFLMTLLPLFPALAESAEDAFRAAYPDAILCTADEWGDTACIAARQDGMMTLSLLERRDGHWEVILTNSKALFQDERVPRLLLDTDNALYWSYGGMVFSSFRDAKGIWGPVTQIMHEIPGGDGNYLETTLTWHADAQEIVRSSCYYDENENLLWAKRNQHIPAPWLADCIQLADFDVTRYPYFEYEEYDGQWPDFAFIREAATYLMPNWTFKGGSFTADECFRFLMERPDGRRVFVGVTCDLIMTVSAPLPAGTYYGVENFTDWLGCGSDSFYLCLNPDGRTWGLSMVMSWRPESEDLLTLSPTHIYSNFNRIVIGEHPWSDITRIDWSTLPTYTMAGYQKTDSTHWVIVRNPDPADRLHLRSSASRESTSKGKYYTGTPAKVLGVHGDWVEVNIAGHAGWMMKKYLEFGDHLITTAEYMPEFAFKNESGNLYALADRGARTTEFDVTYGWRVIGILGDEWYHVWHPESNEYGYVLQKDVTLD